MNMIFMGTPSFAVPSLRKLNEHYGISAVFTQPDRPKGRGNKISMSSVKEEALKNNIPVYQPFKIKNDRESIDIIKKINPDFIIVAAFGQILPKEILDIPHFGCINLHASLLPKYRGAAPINWAVINGEKTSGNTTMFMAKGIDTGDILLQDEIDIKGMTAGELHDILSQRGGDLLISTIEGIKNNSVMRIKQDDAEISYAPMITKETGKINWKDKSCAQIKNLVLGLNPYPSAHTLYKGKMMKVHVCEVLYENTGKTPGCIIDADKDGIKVCAKDGVILLKTIQFPGGKPLSTEEYLRGHKIESGIVLE